MAALSVLLLVRQVLPFVYKQPSGGITFQESRAKSQHDQAAVPFVDLSGAEEDIQTTIDASIEDPKGLLPSDARRSLGQTLTEHIRARASADPGDYLALADREPTRWVDPGNDAAWQAIGLRYEFATDGKQPRRDDPREALRTNLDFALRRESARCTKLCTGPHGMRVIVVAATKPADLSAGVLRDPADVQWWLGLSTFAARFYREPRVPPETILNRDRRLLMAHAFMLLHDSKDRPFIWCSVWFWDPRAQAWLCKEMLAKGHAFHAIDY